MTDKFKASAEVTITGHQRVHKLELFVDSNGFVVEVWPNDQDVQEVSFCPQGGGMHVKLPREIFEDEFKPFAFPLTLHKIKVTGDWMDPGVYVEAYTDGRKWNGWECPWFPADTSGDAFAAMGAVYSPKNDAFVSVYTDDDSEPEYFRPEIKDTVDGPKKLYPIGAMSWCWFEFTEDEPEPEEDDERDDGRSTRHYPPLEG